MPKQIPQDELDAILEAVTQFPEGASVENLSQTLGKKLPRRTLQRRLARLVEQERLAIEGRGRGSRYRFPKITGESHVVIPGFEIKARGEVYIPISPEGKTIKEAVRLPIQDRQPVGYNRAFLDTYRPNESFYLPEETRRYGRQALRWHQPLRWSESNRSEVTFNALSGRHLDLFSGFRIGGITGRHALPGYFRNEFRARRALLLNLSRLIGRGLCLLCLLPLRHLRLHHGQLALQQLILRPHCSHFGYILRNHRNLLHGGNRLDGGLLLPWLQGNLDHTRNLLWGRLDNLRLPKTSFRGRLLLYLEKLLRCWLSR